jgi:arginase family enzyme
MSADWPSISDLFTDGAAEVALIGAPLEAGSVTPGRCDMAPDIVRQILRRFSTYDLVSQAELAVRIADLGDVDVTGIMPADAFAPVRDGVRQATSTHALTILLGGNNAVTRPALHGLGLPLERVGLITLDAHFDMRSTADGPRNGNPVRCLLEDGLPGPNICQVGLAPFANTAAMHRDADLAGIHVIDIGLVQSEGMIDILHDALDSLDHVDTIMVDFDIDVIDRSQCPGAPGARPGGMHVLDFFLAARWLAGHPKVKLVDLTEFDPSLDVSDITALTAGRWVCELLAGYQERGGQ